jgi:heptosyltransferase I
MPRILFVKTSSLGDVIHNCPAVADVARACPDARIDWVIEGPFAAIGLMHPAVHRVIPVALRRWRNRLWDPAVWSEIARFRRALKGERYDAILDTQGLVKSALICRLPAGTRHGLNRASAREALAARFYDVVHEVPRSLHAVERNRRLAAQALAYELDSPCDYGLRAEGAPPQALGAPYAVLLTMTSRTDKLWPEKSWIELGRSLALRAVLPWGNRAERERARRIAGGLGNAVLPEPLSLAELARLFRGARAVIGLDTGLTHLSAALGVPTIALFRGSDPALTGLYGARSTNLGAPGRSPAVAEVLEAIA